MNACGRIPSSRMPQPPSIDGHPRRALRIALSHYVTVGLSATFGLLLITLGVHLWLGAAAAATASVGAIVVTPPDQPAPKHRKFWQLLPAALVGTPLFHAVQLLRADPALLTLLLVTASFAAFLAGAWGKRGLPISMSMMFALVFSMATPASANGDSALAMTLHFAIGAAAYLVYATAANAALNARYRVLLLADTLLSVAALMRTQALQFGPAVAAEAACPRPLIGRLLGQQTALTDQLQSARDILLESPRTARRQRLAAMLIRVLELRDHLLACELDLDALRPHPDQLPVLGTLRGDLDALAGLVEALADALLLGRPPAPFDGHRPRPAPTNAIDRGATAGGQAPGLLARGLVERVGHLQDEVRRLVALARGDVMPDLALVRTNWQLFVSPTTWSWQPLARLWRWDAPPLRHAIRAALAIAAGQALALALPWGTHDYWILLTITVVLRGSLAQTLERRDSRVAGTLLGCLLAGTLLYAHAPLPLLLAVLLLAQGIAHAFAIRRYLVTVVAATVLALLQAHLLNAGVSPAFEVAERVADTLIGVAIAWAFAYVLPSWERGQIPALVARTLAAQARHAQLALGLGQLRAVDDETELGWRLARREVHDSLSALVQAAQRSLAEPRAVRPPLEPLGRMLGHSYQLIAQLTAVRSMLQLRRDRLDGQLIRGPLDRAATAIASSLSGDAPPADEPVAERGAAPGPVALPDPYESDLTPWLLRRLDLAEGLARRLCGDAREVLRPAGVWVGGAAYQRGA